MSLFRPPTLALRSFLPLKASTTSQRILHVKNDVDIEIAVKIHVASKVDIYISMHISTPSKILHDIPPHPTYHNSYAILANGRHGMGYDERDFLGNEVKNRAGDVGPDEAGMQTGYSTAETRHESEEFG
ncbi:MAG: hypothetical protein Q9169_007829 [Polycauliona sp. 2 TL-2023]